MWTVRMVVLPTGTLLSLVASKTAGIQGGIASQRGIRYEKIALDWQCGVGSSAPAWPGRRGLFRHADIGCARQRSRCADNGVQDAPRTRHGWMSRFYGGYDSASSHELERPIGKRTRPSRCRAYRYSASGVPCSARRASRRLADRTARPMHVDIGGNAAWFLRGVGAGHAWSYHSITANSPVVEGYLKDKDTTGGAGIEPCASRIRGSQIGSSIAT